MTNNLQIGVLRRLRDDGPSNAYRLGVKLPTLEALSLKKMVTGDRSRPGSFATPRHAITWTITDIGRLEVGHLDKDGLPVSNGDRQTHD